MNDPLDQNLPQNNEGQNLYPQNSDQKPPLPPTQTSSPSQPQVNKSIYINKPIPWKVASFYKRSIALVKENPKLLLLAVASIALSAGTSRNFNLSGNNFPSNFTDSFETIQTEQKILYLMRSFHQTI